MVELETGWTPSTKLNVIAGEVDQTDLDPLPDDVTRDQIEEYCYTLQQIYGDYVDELVDRTTLSRREAQTWALRNLVYEDAERLSYEAIGLYIWAIGRATEGDPLSRTIVSEYYQRAERKIRRAEATVKRTGPPPYPDDRYEEPALVWVEAAVGERLERRLDPEETYSDLLDRLLDETAASVSFPELVEAYRGGKASDYVAVDTVRPGWDAELRLVVHGPETGEIPAPVADADDLVVDGRHHEFTVEERTELRQEASHVPVFSDVEDGASVALAEGLERLETALATVELTLPEVVDLASESGATALAVDHEPAGAGAHLYPVYPDDAERKSVDSDDSEPRSVDPDDPDRDSSNPYEYLERIPLDDRTLPVGLVSPVTTDEYDSLTDETTLLWADDEATVGPLDLPEDPVQRRERFPTKVLRTA